MMIAENIDIPAPQSTTDEAKHEHGLNTLASKHLNLPHQFSCMHSDAEKCSDGICMRVQRNHHMEEPTLMCASRKGLKVQTFKSNKFSTSYCKIFEEHWNGATLVWRDLTVTIKGKRKYSEKVISTSTGFALPQSITGLMGPPRSGKSTLLRALSDVLPKHTKVYGDILRNGHRGQLNHGDFAYVSNNDQIIETLSVQETLKYAAFLRLPDHIPFTQKHAVVDGIMKIMELDDIADSQIGGKLNMKGISICERRRLSIAMQLLTMPSLVFVDEPTDCLDSVSAVVTMLTLKRLAQTGCTVILTIQNSASEVFSIFDRICLIANGKTVFFGETVACLEHFANAGLPCPLLQNPADHLINALNQDHDRILKLGRNLQYCDQEVEAGSPTISTALNIQTLETSFQGCNDAAVVESLVVQLSQNEGPKLNGTHNATRLTQLGVLTWRSFLNMLRDRQYFWLRFCMSIVLTACLATSYIGFKQSFSMQEQMSAMFYMVFFICLLGVGGFPALIKELKVHSKESSCRYLGYVGTLNFILGNLFSSIPFLFLIASTCSAIGYVFLVLHPSLISFTYFTLIVFLCLLITESLMMIIANVLPRLCEGTLAIVVIQVVMMLVSGYFRKIDKLPDPIWKYPAAYASFYAYAFEGLVQNELLWSKGNAGAAVELQGVWRLIEGKWEKVVALAVLLVVYRIILFLTITLKQQLLSIPSKHKTWKLKSNHSCMI